MSGYVRNVEVKVPFDGQEVRLLLKPLLRVDLFKLQGLLPKGRSPEELQAMTVEESTGAFEFYAGRLPEYVQESDVKDAAGNLVPAAEWVGASYFIELVGLVMTAHMAKATPRNP